MGKFTKSNQGDSAGREQKQEKRRAVFWIVFSAAFLTGVIFLKTVQSDKQNPEGAAHTETVMAATCETWGTTGTTEGETPVQDTADAEPTAISATENEKIPELTTVETAETSPVSTAYIAEATEESTVQMTEESTVQVTEESTMQVTEESTMQVTEESTVQVTEESTVQATEESTAQATEESAVQVTEESTVQATEESTVQTVETAAPPNTTEAERIESPTENKESVSVPIPTVPVTVPAETAVEPMTEVTEETKESAVPKVQSFPRKMISSYVDSLNAALAAHSSEDIAQNPGFSNEIIIPDKRNTGPAPYTSLKKFSESGYVGTISAKEKTAGKKPLYISVGKDSGNPCYNINGYANKQCAEEIVIEGYAFDHGKFYTTNDHILSGEVTVIFRNCRFSQIQSYPGDQLWLVFENCRMEGNVCGNNMIMEKCFLHADGLDALNPNRNIVVKDSYIADLFRKPSSKVMHIDGTQSYGDRYGGISQNIFFDNVRFSIPQITYEDSVTYVNAAINTGLEFSEGHHFLFRNIMIDTGGRWYPIYSTGGESVLFQNVQTANGYPHIFYKEYINPAAKTENVVHSPGLYVTSVWKDDDGKTHFLCSNNNMQTSKNLRVVTNQQEYSYEIPRHPTPEELEQDPVFKTYRFQDLPYDMEFVIEEEITHMDFYDGNMKIRSVTF